WRIKDSSAWPVTRITGVSTPSRLRAWSSWPTHGWESLVQRDTVELALLFLPSPRRPPLGPLLLQAKQALAKPGDLARREAGCRRQDLVHRVQHVAIDRLRRPLLPSPGRRRGAAGLS